MMTSVLSGISRRWLCAMDMCVLSCHRHQHHHQQHQHRHPLLTQAPVACKAAHLLSHVPVRRGVTLPRLSSRRLHTSSPVRQVGHNRPKWSNHLHTFPVRQQAGHNRPKWSHHLHTSPAQQAGHNRWSKIHRKKAVADTEWSKVVQKYSNQICTVIRSGGGVTVDSNIRLASLVAQAKAAGMAKATIDAAILRGTSKQEKGEMVVYEARAEAGYVLVMEVMTDNKNHMRNTMKSFMKDRGCQLGDGSSLFNFEHKGIVRVPCRELRATNTDPLDLAIEVGAEDVTADNPDSETPSTLEPESDKVDGPDACPTNEDCYQFQCQTQDLKAVSDAMKDHSFTICSASLEYIPKTHVELNERKYERALKIVSALSEQEGVMEVYDNFVLKKED